MKYENYNGMNNENNKLCDKQTNICFKAITVTFYKTRVPFQNLDKTLADMELSANVETTNSHYSKIRAEGKEYLT